MSRDADETFEDLRFLDDSGVGAAEAATRCGFASSAALEKWLERHDDYPLWLRMKRRDPVGIHDKTNRTKAETMDATEVLLNEAAKSTRARTRNKAQRVRDLLTELRGTVRLEAAEAERDAAAKVEIARLERELASAKAKLRKTGASTQIDVGAVPAADLRAWALRNGIECAPAGRVPQAVRDAYDAAHPEAESA